MAKADPVGAHVRSHALVCAVSEVPLVARLRARVPTVVGWGVEDRRRSPTTDWTSVKDSAQTPTISVIIPVYNEADVLVDTLESLLAQTFGDFEVICVDDGSTDDSADLVRQVSARDGRIRLETQPNSGAAAARNRGLDLARGTYVCFLDADDVFAPTLFERLLEAIVDTDADFALCEADIFTRGGQGPRPLYRIAKGLAEGLHLRSEFGERLFQSFNKTVWNKLFRTEAVRASGVRFQSLHNMNDLYFVDMMIALSNRYAFVREVLVRYRRGRLTSIQDTRHKHPECALLAADALFRDLAGREVFTPAEHLSLRNECWRLAVQAVESAALGKDVDVLAHVLAETRRLSKAWGVDDMRVSDYSVAAYALWHWCYLRASAKGVMWAYDYDRAPIAEGQPLLSNVLCALRLTVAALTMRERS